MSAESLTRLGAWERQRGVILLLGGALASTGLMIVSLHLLGWSLLAQLTVAVLIGVIILIAGLWRALMKPSMIDCLDDRYHELEDSVSLLLVPPAEPETLARLQQDRVARRLERLLQLPRWTLIGHYRGEHLVGLLASAGVLMLFASSSVPVVPDSLAVGPTFSLRVTPPVYLGTEQFETSNNAVVVVPENSQIHWLIDDGWQVTVDGEALDDAMVWLAEHDALYRITQPGYSDGFGSIAVTLDRAPSVKVIAPANWPLTVGPDEPFGLSVQTADDHGVSDAGLRVTIASGMGEGVKFRDSVVPLEVDSDGIIRWQSMAASLSLEPGDEAYIQPFAVDTAGQNTDGPSIIYRYPDLDEQAFSDTGGMVIDRELIWFRSQRQIIIDTEALLAAADGMPRAEFIDRSEELAFDQRALRIKYGENLGLEVESGTIVPTEIANDSAGESDGHSTADHAHEEIGSDHDSDHSTSNQIDVLEQFGHTHDDGEAATLFKDETKATLKDAVDAMWQAEMHLGLRDPASALPFEYAALTALKSAQSAERIYVKRLGFEPPALDPDRRLTGELDEVPGTISVSRAAAATPASSSGAELLSLLNSQRQPPVELLESYIADPDHPLAGRLAAQTLLADADCLDCRTQLIGELWKSIEPPIRGLREDQRARVYGAAIEP